MFPWAVASESGLFGWVVFLEFPLDSRVVDGAPLDGDLLLVLADGQAVLARAVLHEVRLLDVFGERDSQRDNRMSRVTSASYSQYWLPLAPWQGYRMTSVPA